MVATILIGLVALLHLYFMYLEMFAWDTPAGRKAFGTTPEFSSASKTLAMNQGLYNGFLVAGLVWGLWLGDAGFAVKIFFLACVVIAGLFGAATVSKKVLYVQAIPWRSRPCLQASDRRARNPVGGNALISLNENKG